MGDRTRGTATTLVAMALAGGITSLPNAAIVLALPTLHREFDASIAELQWTVTAYLLAFGALMITGGRLSDLFGRRRMLVVATIVYLGASVLAALATDTPMLIVAMAVLGAAGAVITPASLAVVTNAFAGARRGTAIGVWGAATGFVSAVGPTIGGVLTGELSWRWIFWVNGIVAVAIVALAARYVPESRDEQAERRIDYAGLALSVAGLVGITLALTEAPGWGWGSPRTLGLLGGSCALLTGFVLVELRLHTPMVDLRLLARRNFLGANISCFVMNLAFGAVLFLLPLYLQEILGYGAVSSGLLLLPLTGLLVVGMPIGGPVAIRVGPLPPMILGIGLMTVSLVLLSRVSLSDGYGSLILPLALQGLGVGLALTPINLAAMNAVARRLHGAAGGVLMTMSGLGGTFGVALCGSLFNHFFLNDTVSAGAQSGVAMTRSDAQDLDGLLSGAPGAQAALDRFPAGQRPSVEEAVREGFVSALDTTMLVAAGIAVAGIVLAAALVRRRPAIDADRAHASPAFPGLPQRP